jgi:uncharacterized protein
LNEFPDRATLPADAPVRTLTGVISPVHQGALMTNEERDIIGQFIARVGGTSSQQSGFASGSVPATAQPALPPIDREADTFIGQQFTQNPEARYRITQLAFVQEHALVEAQNRLRRLEWELQQARQAVQQAQQQAQQQAPRSGGGLFGGLFGGNRQQSAPPQQGGPWGQSGGPMGGPGGAPMGGPGGYGYQQQPPPPQYPPNYQQGMFQRQGSGFLGSALTTAAGVAGGMVAGNALMNLFSGSHSGAGALGGGLGGGVGGAEGGASPWATPDASQTDASQNYVDNGGWDPNTAGAGNQDYVDNSGWDQQAPDNSSWDQGSSDQGGGGWDDNSGGGGWDDSNDTF